jgi:hypothetical protein
LHDPLPQGRGTQRVLYGIVVHLAKQDDPVALHRLHQCAGIRVELDRRRRGNSSGGEPKQAGGNSQSEDGLRHVRSVRRTPYLAHRTQHSVPRTPHSESEIKNSVALHHLR